MPLGVFDSLKDWASKKMADSEFVEFVNDATNAELVAPQVDMFMTLIEAANDPRGGYVKDVVRAVRVRLDDPNPKVKNFTLKLLDALIRNCGTALHEEVGDNKGLLHEIVSLAATRPDVASRQLQEARKTAIELIVNCNMWFARHPNPDAVAPLRTLMDQGREAHVQFGTVLPDTAIRICTDVYPRRHRVATSTRGRTAMDDLLLQQQELYEATQRRTQFAQRHQGPPGEVDAIPLEEPSEERVAGMFDAVMLLAECLSAAVQAQEAIRGNEAITALAQQVSKDNRFVLMAVESGATLECVETLRALNESQRTVLRDLMNAAVGNPTGAAAQAGAPAPPVNPAAMTLAPGVARPVVAAAPPPTQAVAAPPAPAPAPAPQLEATLTLDDLFANQQGGRTGSKQAAPGLSALDAMGPSAAVPTASTSSPLTAGGAGKARVARDVDRDDDAAVEMTASPPSSSVAAPVGSINTDAADVVATADVAAAPSEQKPNEPAADDFDAFLNSRLTS